MFKYETQLEKFVDRTRSLTWGPEIVDRFRFLSWGPEIDRNLLRAFRDFNSRSGHLGREVVVFGDHKIEVTVVSDSPENPSENPSLVVIRLYHKNVYWKQYAFIHLVRNEQQLDQGSGNNTFRGAAVKCFETPIRFADLLLGLIREIQDRGDERFEGIGSFLEYLISQVFHDLSPEQLETGEKQLGRDSGRS